MADIYSKAKRALIMSHVRGGCNKKTELALIGLFRHHKISGWRRRWPLYGRPDFVFPGSNVAVFVDGCFWHCCPEHSHLPDSNRAFWQRKLAANKARDRRVTRALRKAGWRVVRIWQHELTHRNESRCVRRIRGALARSRASRQRPGGKSRP
ncbi:MAG: very short patch repair endonuclease [Acidobacteriota bacterium]